MKRSVALQLEIHVSIGLKHQVTTTQAFYSLFDCEYQTIWSLSGESGFTDDTTVMEQDRAETLYFG